MSVFTTEASIASFGGKLLKLTHESASTGTRMAVNVYLPPQALGSSSSSLSSSSSSSQQQNKKKVPVLFFLSGLTCTPDNCSEKGFLQRGAARVGLAVVYPDTSPRGLGLPGERDSWDFGEGASFYLDAAREPFSRNYRMGSYVADELPAALFGDPGLGACLDAARVAVTGHSMGGHGALTLYLRHPGRYASASAFAPVANPTECPWGRKAFEGYFGVRDRHLEEWARHDATELVRAGAWDKAARGTDLRVLVDVGTADNFYKQGQLLTENLEKAVEEAGLSGLTVRYQEGYDHSYYFISTFGDDHINHAAKHLGLL